MWEAQIDAMKLAHDYMKQHATGEDLEKWETLCMMIFGTINPENFE